MQLYSQHTCN